MSNETLGQSEPGVGGICWSDSQACISFSIHFLLLFLIFLTMMEEELTKMGSKSIIHRQRQIFPWRSHLNGILTSQSCCIWMAFSFGYVSFLSPCLMPSWCTENHGSLSAILSQPYGHVCTFSSTQKNICIRKENVYTDIHTNITAMSETLW